MEKIIIDHLHYQEETSNPKSAVGNYIKTLSTILSEGVVIISRQGMNRTKVPKTPKRPLKYILRAFDYIQKHFVHWKLIKKNKPHLSIVFHSPFQFLSALSFKLTKTTLIYDAPTEDLVAEFYSDNILIRKLCRVYDSLILRRATTIVVYGETMQRYIAKLIRQRGNSNIVIHQNVDFARISVNNKRVKVLKERNSMIFVGSFLPWHGVPDFLKSLKRLQGEEMITIHMCGDGPELAKTKAIAKGLSERFNIEFHGFLEPEKLHELLAKSEIGIMPNSNWYGAPAKIFEYLAADCYVFAPQTPTIFDVFHLAPGVFLYPQNQTGNWLNEFIEFVNRCREIRCNPSSWFFDNYSEQSTRKMYLDMLPDR